MEARASLGFDGPRTGMAAWLADPAPMGALDYVSPEATIVTAFVVKSPSTIVDELLTVQQRSPRPLKRRWPMRRFRPASISAKIWPTRSAASSPCRSMAPRSPCLPGSS